MHKNIHKNKHKKISLNKIFMHLAIHINSLFLHKFFVNNIFMYV